MLVTGENRSTRRKTSTSVTFHKYNRPDGKIFIDTLLDANTCGGEGDETKSQIDLKPRQNLRPLKLNKHKVSRF
jgi:hypothetical protein